MQESQEFIQFKTSIEKNFETLRSLCRKRPDDHLKLRNFADKLRAERLEEVYDTANAGVYYKDEEVNLELIYLASTLGEFKFPVDSPNNKLIKSIDFGFPDVYDFHRLLRLVEGQKRPMDIATLEFKKHQYILKKYAYLLVYVRVLSLLKVYRQSGILTDPDTEKALKFKTLPFELREVEIERILSTFKTKGLDKPELKEAVHFLARRYDCVISLSSIKYSPKHYNFEISNIEFCWLR